MGNGQGSLPQALASPFSWELVLGWWQLSLDTWQYSKGGEATGKYGCSCLSFLWELMFTGWIEAFWPSLGQELTNLL